MRQRAKCLHESVEGIEALFWARVVKTDRYWEWIGGRHNGYGQIVYRGQNLGTHRVSWLLAYGPIPPGTWVLHKCDNRPCVRPDHLFLGDIVANTRDRDAKQRQARGAALSAVMIQVAARGDRNAMACPEYREKARRHRWSIPS